MGNILAKKRLGDIINFKRGYDLPSYKRKDGPYPIVSSSGISGYHAEYKAEGEGLVTGRYGTLGEVYYVNGRYWPHNTALYVTNFKGNYPKYVYYLMKCLGNLKTSDKSTVPGVNRNDLHEIFIPYIEPEHQKPIADCLFNIEAKIELNQRINVELEMMAKTLYDYWFVQYDFPNKKGKPYKTSGGEMVWNEQLKRKIPVGWDVGSLLDIADYFNGLACQNFRPTGKESLRVIKIREMRDGFTENSELVRPDIPKKAIIENGDVLFSWSASLEVQIWSGGKGALNQHIFKVTSEKYPKSFYYYQLVNYLQHFKMMAENRKTTMGHITQEHLNQSRIVIPPKPLTLELEKIIAPIFEKKLINDVQSQTLAELRDWLLPMLMNGQVKVG
ncbi:MAG: restriction endonuclease subunit S [Chloroflexi bacterium]|nr:restriction endonuclease subunit S [Chloroflexota bacterium]